jgi:hypothetical protein
MKHFTLLVTVALFCVWSGLGQQASSSNTAAVPHLVRFTGLIKSVAVQLLTGTVGHCIENQEGGAPLWRETPNFTVDSAKRDLNRRPRL